MSEELKLYLEKVAKNTIGQDDEDFMVNDYAGGNIDDAYELGVNAGEVIFARELVKKFFKS